MVSANILPFLAMVAVQVGYAGMNILSKVAMDGGFNPFVFVTYRQIFATVATLPLAIILERNTRPRMTKGILLQVFLCSVTGAFVNQVFYFVGLSNSTATVACALTNILPAITFIFAALFRQETVGIRTMAGQAKVLGTLSCVGGAMLLSFYHGHVINLGNSGIHWRYDGESKEQASGNKTNFFLGPMMLFASATGWALWFIIQAKLSAKYPAPYTTTTLMSLMASVECAVVSVIMEHRASAWSLKSGIRLSAALYSGVVCSSLAFCIMTWCVERKGALYTSIFSPLLLVVVAILSWAILHERIYVGTILGSVLIVAGLYSVLWGKDKEAKDLRISEGESEVVMANSHKQDLEVQLHAQAHINGNGNP